MGGRLDPPLPGSKKEKIKNRKINQSISSVDGGVGGCLADRLPRTAAAEAAAAATAAPAAAVAGKGRGGRRSGGGLPRSQYKSLLFTCQILDVEIG